MEFYHGLFVVIAVIFFKVLSWALILTWQLPVHFSELLNSDSKPGQSCWAHIRSYLVDSDSKLFMGGIVVAPTRDPSASSQMENHGMRLKTWWSSGERSATMELSYISALLSKQTPLFRSEHVALPTHAAISGQVDDTSGERSQGATRDWDTMPEAIRQSKGRFTLRGGSKKKYSDEDLHRNIQGRRLSGRSSGRHRNKFSGWNRQVTEQLPHTDVTSHIATVDSDEQECADEVHDMVGITATKTKPQKALQKDQGRRGTANVQYEDFLPHLSKSEISTRTPIEENVEMQEIDSEDSNIERNRKNYDEILWMDNPSIVQYPGGFRLSDIR